MNFGCSNSSSEQQKGLSLDFQLKNKSVLVYFNDRKGQNILNDLQMMIVAYFSSIFLNVNEFVKFNSGAVMGQRTIRLSHPIVPRDLSPYWRTIQP